MMWQLQGATVTCEHLPEPQLWRTCKLYRLQPACIGTLTSTLFVTDMHRMLAKHTCNADSTKHWPTTRNTDTAHRDALLG